MSSGLAEWEVDPQDIIPLRLVAHGSTAEIYEAQWRGEVIAVKEITLDEGTLLAFQREIEVWPRIDHPNVCRFLGLVTAEPPLRICSEFCHGGTVFDILHNEPDLSITWSQRIKILLDTCLATQYLHSFSPPIIHRDLKSLNLLLKDVIADDHQDPIVKLCDFGFARTIGSSVLQKMAGMTNAAGTYHWMAPEVYLGTEYNEKVDVFSFAMIMYEVIFRKVPFEELEPGAACSHFARGLRPTLAPDDREPPDILARQLIPLMCQCWNQEPALRPTFDTILETLEAFKASI